LPSKVVGFFVAFFGLAGVFDGGFFNADLSGVAGGFLFVDGVQLADLGVFAVAPQVAFLQDFWCCQWPEVFWPPSA